MAEWTWRIELAAGQLLAIANLLGFLLFLHHPAQYRVLSFDKFESFDRLVLDQRVTNRSKITIRRHQLLPFVPSKLKLLVSVIHFTNSSIPLAGKIERMNAELVELESSIDISTSKLNNLVAEKTRTAAIVQSYEEENEWRNANVSNPKLSTNISSIFDTYGFVTLPVGNNAGVVGGSALEVVRDGSVVAKLLVKTVEAGTAAAEIVPGSLQADTVLMVGDEIRAAQAKKSAPAPAAAPVAPAAVDAGAADAAEGAEPAMEDAAPAEDAAEADAAPAEAEAEAAEEDPFQ
jgi:hypothetical protein